MKKLILLAMVMGAAALGVGCSTCGSSWFGRGQSCESGYSGGGGYDAGAPVSSAPYVSQPPVVNGGYLPQPN